ncbi:MAG: hypothetical protein BAA04_07360 [Firmicutes bacterium ZCTH02-B6]|nr:MAG: hypothetical protein BAA04_07360 [Firmicutes bacterium ZCTH02-B6]
MLLTVLILAPAALGTGGAAWWFAAGSAVLFFARRPWEIWLQTAPDPDKTARRAALFLTAGGLALGAAGLWVTASPLTAVLAVLAAVLAGASAYSESRPERRGAVAGRLAGVTAMVTLLLLEVAAAFGRITPAGWGLAGLCLAYFLTSALRVRSLVRARKVQGFRLASLVLHGCILVGAAAASRTGWVPQLAAVAYVPGVVQAARILRRDAAPVNTLRMGIGEILHAAAFVALTILVYRLPG